MKVYHNIDEFQEISNAIVTTGTFDGVHAGHKVIIQRLKEIAAKVKGETVILTFFPHPRMVLFPEDNDLKLINSQEEKIQLLEKCGIDHLIIQPFTKEFSRLTSLEFVRSILVQKLKTKKLVIGYNHHFGRNREGTFEHLLEYGPVYGFEVEEIPSKDIDNISVSSTKIRNALHEGDIESANKYLGYEFMLSGKVVKGSQRGKTIGFPTANIAVQDVYKIIPAVGVYAARVDMDSDNNNLKAMLNIGYRPTFDGNSIAIEAHIFNFAQDIYERTLTLHFKARLRDEKKFENIEALKKQLSIDRNKSLQLLV